MGSFIEIAAADGFKLPAYLATPAGQVKGAVVVLQEVFGVNSHICSVADGYAAAGYLAIAPATFHRVQAGVDLGYTQADMGQGIALKAAVEGLPAPGVLQDIQAAIDLVRQASGGKVGIVGYCWGGLLSWRAACLLKGLSAAVCYYGGGMTGPEESARQPVCPVLAHFGKKDHWIAMDSVNAFAAKQSGVSVQAYEADHGFNCDQRGSYDEPAAMLALQRTLDFFARHLA